MNPSAKKIKNKATEIYSHFKNIQPKYWGIAIGSSCAALLCIAAVWISLINCSGPLENQRVVDIPKGAGAQHIAETLSEFQVTGSNPFWFRLNAKLMLVENQLQAGVYSFEPEVSLKDVINKIAGGDVATYQITFPEGTTVFEMSEIISKAPNMTGDLLIDPVEGEFLPETYQYTHGQDRGSLVKRMAADMRSYLDKVWRERELGVPLKNKNELLTLASIIEKETAVDGERTTVASVYINRLNKNMRLQSDPTVIYGASNYKGDITRKHLREKHPYNTYVHKGLPPGPICNPGKASIYAAAHPEETDYLFFVADGKGGHVFAETHTEHKENVQAYLKAYRSMAKK